MTEGQSAPIDQPFPGAHSQVPHTQGTAAPGLNPLPLEASQTRTEQRWTVRLPVRAEHVSVAKQTVVRERVIVRRRRVEETATVDGEISREVLRVDKDGDVEIEDVGAARREGGRNTN